jgi:hypothetical protein
MAIEFFPELAEILAGRLVFHSIERNLGKLLFPRSERWERKRKLRVVLVILLVELVLAGIILAAAYLGR